jgi:hypothetical protein
MCSYLAGMMENGSALGVLAMWPVGVFFGFSVELAKGSVADAHRVVPFTDDDTPIHFSAFLANVLYYFHVNGASVWIC